MHFAGSAMNGIFYTKLINKPDLYNSTTGGNS